MRAKRAEAWAVFDNTKLGPYLVPTRIKARKIYATLERGTRRIVHLTEADPARDRVYRAALRWVERRETHTSDDAVLLAVIEDVLKGKNNKGGR